MASLFHMTKKGKTKFPLQSFEVIGRIDNLTTELTFEMTYKNDTIKVQDANYEFPIGEFVLYYFEAKIGQRRLIAKCRPAVEAEEAFKEATQSGYQAALGQQEELVDDTFHIRLGNVPAKASIAIKLKLTCLLKLTDDKTVLFTLPNVLNEKYRSSVDTSQGSRISRISNNFVDWLKAAPKEFKFTMSVSMPTQILKITSEKEKLSTLIYSDDNSIAMVTLNKPVSDDHDLQIAINLATPLPTAFLASELGQPDSDSILGSTCLAAHFCPQFNLVNDRSRGAGRGGGGGDKTEIVILIDRSGSMSGSRIQFAKEALLLLLKSLPQNCHFQIIGFGSGAAKLFDKPESATRDNLQRALDYQSGLEANMGGTEAFGALQMAFTDPPVPGDDWIREIIYITDGEIDNVTEVIALASQHATQSRVFTIGIGHGVSEALINGVAQVANGRGVCVRQNSQLQPAVMQVLDALMQPKAREVSVEWDLKHAESEEDKGRAQPVSVVAMPNKLPPIFPGQFATAYGLVKGVKSGLLFGRATLAFKLTGANNSLEYKLTCDVNVRLDDESSSSSSLPLHRLAGRCQLTQLLNTYAGLELGQGQEKGDASKEQLALLKAPIEQLSVDLNVVTRFTSFVVIDDSKQEQLPLELEYTYPYTYRPGGPPRWSYLSRPGRQLRWRGYELRSLARGPQLAVYPHRSSSMALPMPCSLKSASRSSTGFQISSLSRNRSYDLDESVPMTTKASAVMFDQFLTGKHSNKSLDLIAELAQLQDFDGYWMPSDRMKTLIGISELGNPIEAKQIACSDDQMVDNFWFTCLVIAYLNKRQSDRSVEWKFLVGKAEDWFNRQAEEKMFPQLADENRQEKIKQLLTKAELVVDRA